MIENEYIWIYLAMALLGVAVVVLAIIVRRQGKRLEELSVYNTHVAYLLQKVTDSNNRAWQLIALHEKEIITLKESIGE